MKHTPGPWECKPFLTPEYDDDPMAVYVIDNIRFGLEQRYADAEAESDELDAVHAENAANASLIAAAPDLLEALKFMVHRFHGFDKHGSAHDAAVIEDARKAIAKAEKELA